MVICSLTQIGKTNYVSQFFVRLSLLSWITLYFDNPMATTISLLKTYAGMKWSWVEIFCDSMQSGGYQPRKKGAKFHDNMKSTKLGHLNAQNPLIRTYLNSFEGHVTLSSRYEFLNSHSRKFKQYLKYFGVQTFWGKITINFEVTYERTNFLEEPFIYSILSLEFQM